MKKNIKALAVKIKQAAFRNKKRTIITLSAGSAAVMVFTAVLILARAAGRQEAVYKETEVAKGNLTVGITESGTVDIGTMDETFDLDLSELARSTSSGSSQETGGSNSSQGGMGAMGGSGQNMGGMGIFDQIFGLASESGKDTSSGSSSLEVSEVMVSPGQQVKKGDVLYHLAEQGAEELRQRLESDVEKAQADLQLVYAQQEEDKQNAQHTYDSSIAYGDYAQAEYDTAVSALEAAAADLEKSLELAKEEVKRYEERLAQTQKEYETAAEMLARAEWSAANTDKWNSTGLYVEYESLKNQAESAAAGLESEIQQLEDSIEQTQDSIEMLEKQISSAKRELALGKLTAQQTFDLRMLAYNAAQETYDIAMAYLEAAAAEQEETYENAKQRWEEFCSHISGSSICAQHDGIITDVYFEAGDAIYTGDPLITLYDLEEVAVTVSVEEDDMADIQAGTLANVVFTAYPEEVFTAQVTEISDAVTSSSGVVTYSVTVLLKGSVEGLFQGMTGDITFITRESKEVLYVSNRAVIRKDGKSYVKQKDSSGNIKTVEVVTGFSDGVNVEIVEGLSEGDIVLIESKVNKE